MPQSAPCMVGAIHKTGSGLGRAVEALETIDATGLIEQAMTWVLLQAYRRGLRAIVTSAPAWMSEEIVSASELMDSDGLADWMRANLETE